jgi:acyl carrier protein
LLTDGMSDTEHELRRFILDELASAHGIDSFGPDDDLIRLGIVDSLGMQELVGFCEATYGVRIEDEDLVPEHFQTLRQLAAFIDGKRVASAPSGSRLGLRRR